MKGKDKSYSDNIHHIYHELLNSKKQQLSRRMPSLLRQGRGTLCRFRGRFAQQSGVRGSLSVGLPRRCGWGDGQVRVSAAWGLWAALLVSATLS